MQDSLNLVDLGILGGSDSFKIMILIRNLQFH